MTMRQMWSASTIEKVDVEVDKNLTSLVIGARNEETGKDFTVVVITDKDAPGIDYHTALRTATYALGRAYGLPEPEGTEAYNKAKDAN